MQTRIPGASIRSPVSGQTVTLPRGVASIGTDCYKIKLRDLGYRLVYWVGGDGVVVVVLTVGKRERGEVYELARKRFNARPT